MAGHISWTQLFKNSWQGFSQKHLPGGIFWILAICLGPAARVIMNSKKAIIIGAALGLTILVWVCALLLIKSAQIQSKDEKAQKTSPKKPELTLLYLFGNDFNNLLRSGQEATFVDEKGGKIIFKTKEFFDFEAQSKFIGFYIPSSPYTFDLLVNLPKVYQRFSSTDKVMVEAGAPGLQPVNIAELKFSGRVFIYHEYPILEAQKRELYSLYEKHGLAPQFRGSEYLFKKKEIEEKTH